MREKNKKTSNNRSADLIYLKEAKKIIDDVEERPSFNARDVLEMLKTMLACLEEKDSYTHGHSIRVTQYATNIAIELGLSAEQIEEVQLVGLLHDIGKVGIPDNVLLKPAPLTKPEFEIMKSHPIRSARILEKANALKSLIEGVKYHHERIDGLGYPDGLKGDEIPLYARIILIADTYDAMTSTRPYRLALEKETAFKELERYSGTQFDANLVKVFIQSMQNEHANESAAHDLLKQIA